MADDAAPARKGPSDAPVPHRFTWDEIVRLAAANVFGETTRLELIGGEIFTMPEEGFLHVDVVHVLQRFLLTHAAPLGLSVFIREPVHLADGSVLIPDLCVFPAGTTARGMQAARSLLIIEVSDSTLAYDRDVKSPRYSADGVPELWIVDARGRAVGVHRAPIDGAWTFVDRFTSGRVISALCAPSAAFDPTSLPDPEAE
jgi:Uma2 family endonuclease